MSNKRRFFLILVSVTIGSLFSVLLMMSRKGTLDRGDYATLLGNLAMSLLLLFALILGMRWMSKRM